MQDEKTLNCFTPPPPQQISKIWGEGGGGRWENRKGEHPIEKG